MFKYLKLAAVPFTAVSGMLVSGLVHAQAATPGVPDVTAITGAITTDTTNSASIAQGVLLLSLGLVAFHWIRKAF